MPSLEGYMALMHVTPSAKGLAIVTLVQPTTQRMLKQGSKAALISTAVVYNGKINLSTVEFIM